MNGHEERYTRFALAREMMETAEVIRKLDVTGITGIGVQSRKAFLTGEGSSRIFPAKNVRWAGLRSAWPYTIMTEGGDQALEYDLNGMSVFVASNSGRTAEAVRLLRKLKGQGHSDITGITTSPGSPVASETDRSYILTCGGEDAVAATKSVVEQALVYDLLFRSVSNVALPDLSALAEAVNAAMTAEIPSEIIRRVAASPVIYFAGRNNGVAEELALKTNEITRKKSAYLEGSYAVHGIEEVMEPKEALVVIDPFEAEEEKFEEVLSRGVGLSIFAIASRETRFPTLRIPEAGSGAENAGCLPYVQLAAGWNLLVETGLELGIDLDKPERARKVGNEIVE